MLLWIAKPVYRFFFYAKDKKIYFYYQARRVHPMKTSMYFYFGFIHLFTFCMGI